MLNRFLTAVLYELLHYAQKHPDFSNTDSANLPAPIKAYLSKVQPSDFMRDIRLLVKYANGENLITKDNALLTAIAEFLTINLSTKIDQLHVEFYRLKAYEQAKQIEELVSSHTLIAQTLKEMLVKASLEELTQAVYKFIKSVVEVPYIIVQTPREMSAELKKEIRNNLREHNHALSFPIFQINKNLIGGLRVFVNGKVTDNSWLGRINHITSLNYV